MEGAPGGEVRIELRRGTVSIPSSSCDDLLEQLESRDALSDVPDVREAFLDAGTEQPVSLTDPQKLGLRNAISFWVVGMFWLGHHRAFSLASRHSRRMLGWNLFLLGVIAFMPFATAFWALNMGSLVPALFYCVTLLVAALLNVQVVRIATGPDMVDPAADPALISYCRRRGLSVVLGAATAILLGIFVPRYAQVALISIPVWRRLLMIGRTVPAA